MKSTLPNASRLSAIDTFFVAYQESSGVLMQLGAEVEFKGRITRDDLDQVLLHIVLRWPPLRQRLQRRLFGLWWEGDCRTGEMLHVAERREALAEWRNRPLNPFAEPPFQILWLADCDRNLLAFRAHHAVVDGEGFLAVCVEALRKLAEIMRPGIFPDEHGSDSDACSSGKIRGRTPGRRLKLLEALENVQRMRRESRSNQSARIAMRSCTPGETSIIERDLERDDLRELRRQATELGVAPGWLCASAWMKAIHAWNLSSGINATPVISIEVPVSLRRSRDNDLRIGNLISPLTLYGDATQPVEELAMKLKHQMTRAMRQRSHLALPLLSSPAKLLPWRLFRKLAANPELTGFATSHFAWFEQPKSINEEVFRMSGGALQIVGQQIYTPVCLHMGVAMAILVWPERAQIFLTHRLTALSTNDANTLLDLMVQELGQRYLSRQQVAV